MREWTRAVECVESGRAGGGRGGGRRHRGLSFSPDGHLLASACGDGVLRLWVSPMPQSAPNENTVRHLIVLTRVGSVAVSLGSLERQNVAIPAGSRVAKKNDGIAL